MNVFNFFYKLKYNFEFLRHSKSHKATTDEKRLRKVIIQNYTKSLIISNILACYLNYIRQNKKLTKTIFSKLV